MKKIELTNTEATGKKHLMAFLEDLIINFKQKEIASESLMLLTKAFYLLDFYKKINYEGYLSLEAFERDENRDLRGFVLRINRDEVTLSYEGYVHGPFGGDSEYEEMFSFNNDDDEFTDPSVSISIWVDDFNDILTNNGSYSIIDTTENIEKLNFDDID